MMTSRELFNDFSLVFTLSFYFSWRRSVYTPTVGHTWRYCHHIAYLYIYIHLYNNNFYIHWYTEMDPYALPFAPRIPTNVQSFKLSPILMTLTGCPKIIRLLYRLVDEISSHKRRRHLPTKGAIWPMRNSSDSCHGSWPFLCPCTPLNQCE